MSEKREYLFKLSWWKWLCIFLLFYTIIGGLLVPVPRLAILHETIRNLFFHVTSLPFIRITCQNKANYGIFTPPITAVND